MLLVLVAACHGSSRTAQDASTEVDGGEETAAVPVKLAQASRRDLPVIVSGPGRTESIETHEVRAPFDGVLTDLLVTDGDRVALGQVLGWLVSSDSQAALEGARQMLQTARNPEQRRDAQRALALAKRGLVKTALRAPETGLVLSHQADEGGRLTANQTIVTIVAADAIVFVAQIAQVDLARVRAGDPAVIDLAADALPQPATVYAVLPGGSATDLTAPVRLDFAACTLPEQVNLFGVAHITVGVRPGALVVPAAAVLRDDVTGVSRIAMVDPAERAHWVEVKVGLSGEGEVEILSPPFSPGTRVVVSGLVGLPEGARVQVAP
jgi:multidrug efflux pump subunit AcrA (membrane-fusion protein)